jgi:hypothetical protein
LSAKRENVNSNHPNVHSNAHSNVHSNAHSNTNTKLEHQTGTSHDKYNLSGSRIHRKCEEYVSGYVDSCQDCGQFVTGLDQSLGTAIFVVEFACMRYVVVCIRRACP